jgi:hypothetical protein
MTKTKGYSFEQALQAGTRQVTYKTTAVFGMMLALPFMWIAYKLVDHAITVGADLTATGVAVGAIGGSMASLMAIFVYRAVQAQDVPKG